ncbi:hypothetical protein [Thioclava pacifica]|uniref:Uncharacterized protein n=1 Tax=Thioclava pacifica DSM 10166 TaxID=1353537 RepID=A0A074J478_9RHOB|nr:hypothetical protein [Thioclava pacifica]KEO51309.1 hypothetical protein TP2_13015 [Thioclava pacifica DSM 10166]
MSAPDTNLDRQKRRHAPALIGMAVMALLGVALVFAWIAAASRDAQTASETPPAETPAAAIPTTDGVVKSEPPAAPLDGTGPSTTQAPATTGVGGSQ